MEIVLLILISVINRILPGVHALLFLDLLNGENTSLVKKSPIYYDKWQEQECNGEINLKEEMVEPLNKQGFIIKEALKNLEKKIRQMEINKRIENIEDKSLSSTISSKDVTKRGDMDKRSKTRRKREVGHIDEETYFKLNVKDLFELLKFINQENSIKSKVLRLYEVDKNLYPRLVSPFDEDNYLKLKILSLNDEDNYLKLRALSPIDNESFLKLKWLKSFDEENLKLLVPTHTIQGILDYTTSTTPTPIVQEATSKALRTNDNENHLQPRELRTIKDLCNPFNWYPKDIPQYCYRRRAKKKQLREVVPVTETPKKRLPLPFPGFPGFGFPGFGFPFAPMPIPVPHPVPIPIPYPRFGWPWPHRRNHTKLRREKQKEAIKEEPNDPIRLEDSIENMFLNARPNDPRYGNNSTDEHRYPEHGPVMNRNFHFRHDEHWHRNRPYENRNPIYASEEYRYPNYRPYKNRHPYYGPDGNRHPIYISNEHRYANYRPDYSRYINHRPHKNGYNIITRPDGNEYINTMPDENVYITAKSNENLHLSTTAVSGILKEDLTKKYLESDLQNGIETTSHNIIEINFNL